MSHHLPYRADDAEKGIIDPDHISPPEVALTVQTSTLSHAASASTFDTLVQSNPMESLGPLNAPAKQPSSISKPAVKVFQSRASRWIRFQLWFNTYRLALLDSDVFQPSSSTRQKVFRAYFNYQHNRDPTHPSRSVEISSALYR